ncbi:hypothetical protein [Roseofilum casamattae]|uniref:Uncharacterized protein n=1 Tax=Roseofilum casamattae BLCC-M143 TaxID=3022442 RepID=A0ABT7BV45_9CYAN|nr:hypothetical protein [Roseofilum casamattae]MDJ1183062.1 hypothetical protein [Roseofilum casamattae BLCC-M143]
MPIFERRKKNNQSRTSPSSSQFGPKIPSTSSKNNTSKPNYQPILQRSGKNVNQPYGYPVSNTVQAKQDSTSYPRVSRFAPTIEELNNSARQPVEPILRPQRQHAGLTLQRSSLSSSTVIQRDVMAANTFNNQTKYTGFGKAGASYTNIKNALAAYHTTKDNASVEQKLAMLRKIGHLCYVWMNKYLTIDVDSDTGTLSYKHEKQGKWNENKKSKTRKAGIIQLQEQVYAEHHNIVANLESSNSESPNVLRVYQGQGGTADLRKTTIVSHNFTTCTPVVMFNNSTKLGGLFHYATGSLDNQAMEMVNMAKYIQPTHVYIYAGAHMNVSPNSEDAQDKELGKLHASNQQEMANFFSFCQTKYNSTVSNQQGFAGTISISLEDGVLEVNTGFVHPKATVNLRSLKDEENKDISENLPSQFLALTSSEIVYDDLEIALEEIRYEQGKLEDLKGEADVKFLTLGSGMDLTKIDMDKMRDAWIAARQQDGVELENLTMEDYEEFILDNKNNKAFFDDDDYGQ